MFYNKNKEAYLSDSLFKNPTSEYRGTPFWAWNCKLEEDELIRQIDVFKEMGFGGFHMHVRTGLATKYLSDEHMNAVSSCVEKAKKENMLAYLYDEDRWPSGFAGGYVTGNEKYRARCLVFTPVSNAEAGDGININDSRAEGGRSGNGRLIACYDVSLDSDGYLDSYKRTDENTPAKGVKWYAYLEVHTPSAWFNNQTYVDTLNKEAIEKFIEITYETYKKHVGDEFSKTIPSIFTDEPQFTRKNTLKNSTDKSDVVIPWTDDIPETYKACYGDDILDSLPELFWEKKDGVSVVRYHYHDHISERFASAFADTCGKWCRENGIALTGHMMEEPTLMSQTAALGDCMRSYRGFDIPGIDMLCHNYELTTAKQAQSAVRQYGREGMLSELYGVTGWDYDFRHHKIHGDWQTALGVTVRVPHLAWVSMEGEAKRDYPASINYQSPWYKEYKYIEDHFSRVHTAMTRGKPVVRVGVIHPVESFWLHFGPNDKTALKRQTLDSNFQTFTRRMLDGSVDFDFICESLLPSQCEKGSAPLRVGKMSYDVIIVPGCETLRDTTFERLEKFKADGGRLVIMGSAPVYENAVKTDRGAKLSDGAVNIAFDRSSLLDALDDVRDVTIRDIDGTLTDNLIYQLRRDNGCDWLFIAHSSDPDTFDAVIYDDVSITVPGHKTVYVYDTLSGEIRKADYRYKNNNTVITHRIHSCDSLLLKLENKKSECAFIPDKKSEGRIYRLNEFVDYELSEKNVLLLDMAQFRVDSGEWQEREEILRANNKARLAIGLKEQTGNVAQPWVMGEAKNEHTISFRFTVHSAIQVKNALFAVENAESAEIIVNGEKIDNTPVGFFCDRSIDTVKLPELHKGDNIIELTLPLGETTSAEWCYILGDFGVKVSGTYSEIIERSEKISFSDLVNQGFPFYGGAITYKFDVETKNGFMDINIPLYKGAVMKVFVDGEDRGYICYSPFELYVDKLSDGVHKVEIKLFIHRYNCFGAVHNTYENHSHYGPDGWRTKDWHFSYEYILRRTGIYSSPRIKV